MAKRQKRSAWGSSYDRHFRALNYAPSRNPGVQAEYLETVKAISDALIPAGLAQPPSAISLGHSRSGASGRLRWVIDASYAEGMLNGLMDGWHLHAFGIKLERDLRHRYIVRYLQKHPKEEDRTDEKICVYLDAQIDRLANMEDNKKPMPLLKWRNVSWSQALKDKRRTGRRNRVCDSVMSYLTFCRQLQESKEYSLLRAWEDLSRESAESLRRTRAIVKKYANARRRAVTGKRSE